MVLKTVYNTQNYWAFVFLPSSAILKQSREHYISTIRCVSVHRERVAHTYRVESLMKTGIQRQSLSLSKGPNRIGVFLPVT
jgi:hypothetical protein